MALLQRSGVGRNINRHYYTQDEVRTDLSKEVVRKLIELIRFRNLHPAFSGEATIQCPAKHTLSIAWRRQSDWAVLVVDFAAAEARIEYSSKEADGAKSILIGVHQRAETQAVSQERAQ